MTDQVLIEFRGDIPEPDAETTRRIYLRVTRSRRRRTVRVAAGAAVAAAVALGILGVPTGDGPSSVARAAAALNPSGKTILHTVVVSTRDGSTATDRSETWQQNASPYDRRTIEGRGEDATADGSPQFYDARTNTIYTVAPGTELPPRAGRPKEHVERLLDYVRNLLAAGEAREDGRLAVDGRDAIRIVAPNLALVVDAETYAPIEWTIVSDDGVRITSRFETYELLSATDANLALLSLTAQHPDARVAATMEIEGVSRRP